MKIVLVLLCACLFGPVTAFAQGESALPFLLISPAAVSNGMGEASVALYRDDPLAAITNPAHLGMFSRTNYFSAGYDYADWLPGFQQSDLTFKTFGFNGGVNLRTLFGIAPELSLGVAYSRIRLNLGTFSVTSPDGPEVIASYEAYETADNYSVGLGLHYWISATAGFTYKEVHSNLGAFNVQGQDREGKVTVPTTDFGFLVLVPVFGIVDSLQGSPLTFLQNFSPMVNLSAGVAKNNMGDKMVVYIDPAQPDPLPRFARAGVGVEIGFSCVSEGLMWFPLVYSWTRESNDILVRRFPPPTDSNGVVIGDPPPAEYRDGLGDIKFVDDVILGKSNPLVEIKTGWQLRFFEVVTLRGGTFHEDPSHGNRNFTTSGFTVSLGGAIKMLRVMKVPLDSGDFLGSVLTRLDLRYSHSELETREPDGPLDETEFSSWTLVFNM
jgi:hypothetical protein